MARLRSRLIGYGSEDLPRSSVMVTRRTVCCTARSGATRLVLKCSGKKSASDMAPLQRSTM